MQSLVVQKYGGSSVSTPEKIKIVAQRIVSTCDQGYSVVVVVSAMGDTTDELIALAKKVSHGTHERELDMLLSAGERISMALLSMALSDLGKQAISFTGSQAGIITDESHTQANILEIRPYRIQEELERGKVVIVAGFQGVSRTKEVTTLGRGGSDTTAVALANVLKAKRCEVFTDVPGVFSADPTLVPHAISYTQLPLDLVFEMAVTGAQVMHARSIEIARQAGFSIFVGHYESGKGTMLVPELSKKELPEVVAITLKKEPLEVSVICHELSKNTELQKKITNLLNKKEFGNASYTTTRAHSLTIKLSHQNPQSFIQSLHDALVRAL